ncbi:MAG: class I SAM-dependent methyltransferase [Aeromicrobium sp.]|nr:class I SAM-dependent methyltransferase [Burkholderiales bacterium]
MSGQRGYPNGHYYSPVINIADIEERSEKIWPATPDLVGIDFNHAGHEQLLREVFPQFVGSFEYSETMPIGVRDENAVEQFFQTNSQFAWLDSIALFVLMRHWRPKQIIEVGSGFSSLLMADVNRRFLNSAVHITCIEPYPRQFLKRTIAGINVLIRERVQNVPLDIFANLESGDILFIDSSHISKTDSDVNYLMFEIVPRLKAGVLIHIHDIFLPHDYPREWVVERKRCWNEQYLVRALLTLNCSFRIEFGSAYAFYALPQLLKQALSECNGRFYGGSSLWIRKLV